MLQKTLKSDEEGIVEVEAGALSEEEIKTARDKGFWGYEYRVEARVVDQSRREVRSTGSIKVARTAFAAYLNPQRYLYLPGDTVKVDLRTLDPNDQPVAAEGFVTIFKRVWTEEKKNADGKIEPGYDDTKLFAKPAVTGETGETTVEFQPSEAAVYLLRYETRDRFGEPVSGETTVIVADQNTSSVGYRSGGVEIITDKQTYKRGETAHVMLATRRPGVAVWFAVEGERIHEQKIVRLDGAVKLLEIPVTEDLEPNIYLTAVSLFDYSAFRDTQQIIIPPVRQFLNVKVTTDAADYRPGQTATVNVEVTDDEGKPVETELELGAADAAVWAIQGDVAGDIRQAFWSRMRGLAISTQASPEQSTPEFWKPNPDKPGEFEPFRREGIAEARDKKQENLYFARGDMEGRQISFGRPMLMKGTAMVENEDIVIGDGAMEAVPGAYIYEDAKRLAAYDEPIAGRPAAEARLRTDFRSTAFWNARIVTDAEGHATADIPLPDSLTTWNVTARAADKTTRVGQDRETFKTNKPIMIRPQGPRYFIEGDESVISAIVNNNTSQTQTVRVELEIEGLSLLAPPIESAASAADEATSPVATASPSLEIRVPSQGQRRVDWRVKAVSPGTAVVRNRALTPVELRSHAMPCAGPGRHLAGGGSWLSERSLDAQVDDVHLGVRARALDEVAGEEVRPLDERHPVAVDSVLEHEVELASNRRLRAAAGRAQHASGHAVDRVVRLGSPEHVVPGRERQLGGRLHLGLKACRDDVLTADQVRVPQVLVRQREELIERPCVAVGRIAVAGCVVEPHRDAGLPAGGARLVADRGRRQPGADVGRAQLTDLQRRLEVVVPTRPADLAVDLSSDGEATLVTAGRVVDVQAERVSFPRQAVEGAVGVVDPPEQRIFVPVVVQGAVLDQHGTRDPRLDLVEAALPPPADALEGAPGIDPVQRRDEPLLTGLQLVPAGPDAQFARPIVPLEFGEQVQEVSLVLVDRPRSQFAVVPLVGVDPLHEDTRVLAEVQIRVRANPSEHPRIVVVGGTAEADVAELLPAQTDLTADVDPHAAVASKAARLELVRRVIPRAAVLAQTRPPVLRKAQVLVLRRARRRFGLAAGTAGIGLARRRLARLGRTAFRGLPVVSPYRRGSHEQRRNGDRQDPPHAAGAATYPCPLAHRFSPSSARSRRYARSAPGKRMWFSRWMCSCKERSRSASACHSARQVLHAPSGGV